MKEKGKIIIILLIVVVLCGLGYYLFFSTKNEKVLKDKMIKASRDYFEKYMSVNDSTYSYVVTLSMLENAEEKYDLKGLEKCNKNTTKAELIINYNTGKPKKVKVELNC